VQLDVLGEQRLERFEVTPLGGGEEALRELLPLLTRCLEPGTVLADVPPGSGGELTSVVLTGADDLGDLGEGVVEDVVEQERRPLLRG
jgi:hypothetical protein